MVKILSSSRRFTGKLMVTADIYKYTPFDVS
jgi:hypothetical protein